MVEATSCGGVVIFRGKILLLYKNYKNKYEGWVLPKGTVEQGEEHNETALREVKEETGLDVVLYDDFRLTDEHPLIREGRPDDIKTNVYFLAEYRDQVLRAQETEVIEVLLMDYTNAMESIQYEGSKRLLSEAENYLNAHHS